VPENTRTAEKILTAIKGLQGHLRADETPILAEPAIWDGGQGKHSETCDVVVTDQRLLGYYYRSFPREKLFLDALDLADISNVTLRQRNYSPVFREIQISAGPRKVSIRTPRQKSDALYASLRSVIGDSMAPAAATEESVDVDAQEPIARPAPVYGRQDIQIKFDRSPLAIMILFIGGIMLEIIGAILWISTQSAPIGLPLCIAGFLAVAAAFVVRRQNSRPAA
jgi:hypothetical protein